MNFSKRFRVVFFTVLISVCLIVFGFFGWVSWGGHPDPVFNVGNNFNQPVTVYFEGRNQGNIDAGQSRKFYPNEVLDKTNSDLLVELKSNSGLVLYSRNFTWDELTAVLELVKGAPYWIGPGS